MNSLKTSNVWVYFTHGEIENKVKCKLCHKFLRGERSFNLRKHLKSAHKVEVRIDKKRRLHTNFKTAEIPDIPQYSLIEDKTADNSGNFFDINTQTLDQTNDSEGRDLCSILPTNSSVIEIKEELVHEALETECIENNSVTNEAITEGENEPLENNNAVTKSNQNTGIESLNATKFVEYPSTSKNIKQQLKDPLNDCDFLTQKSDSKPQIKKRKTTSTIDPLDDNTSSSKDNNFEEWSKKKKELLEIELLEMRNYKYKLDLWEREKELQVDCSKYTREIRGNK